MGCMAAQRRFVFFLLSPLVVVVVAMAAILQSVNAVEYQVINNATGTAGGTRYTTEIGDEYSNQTLISATEFIWQTLRQMSDADRKSVENVTMIVETIDGVAYTSNNEIHVSATYMENYTGDVKMEFTGVIYHEMTHVWQWNGNGQTPSGLIEGIADYVRLKGGYAPSQWVQPGEGDSWDQGYDVTAYFLDYCNGLSDGFVAQLNFQMETNYSESYFQELLGKMVDELWSDYKAKYAN